MNIYRHQFVCVCPENAKPIIYNLEIQTEAVHVIRVEHIALACGLYQQAFHEKIADDLFRRFGGLQVLKAHHHGVDIETRRGALTQLPAPVEFTSTAAA
jgi:hypothetical protein